MFPAGHEEHWVHPKGILCCRASIACRTVLCVCRPSWRLDLNNLDDRHSSWLIGY
jgi:hypothetical protein